MTSENLELSVTRLIDAPVETVWNAATERLAEWWCPKPWTVEKARQRCALVSLVAELDRSPIGPPGGRTN